MEANDGKYVQEATKTYARRTLLIQAASQHHLASRIKLKRRIKFSANSNAFCCLLRGCRLPVEGIVAWWETCWNRIPPTTPGEGWGCSCVMEYVRNSETIEVGYRAMLTDARCLSPLIPLSPHHRTGVFEFQHRSASAVRSTRKYSLKELDHQHCVHSMYVSSYHG